MDKFSRPLMPLPAAAIVMPVVGAVSVAATAIASAVQSGHDAQAEKYRRDQEQIRSDLREKEINGELEMKKLDNEGLSCENGQKLRTQAAVDDAITSVTAEFAAREEEMKKAHREKLGKINKSQISDVKQLKKSFNSQMKNLRRSRDAELNKLTEELRILKIESKESGAAKDEKVNDLTEELRRVNDERSQDILTLYMATHMDKANREQQELVKSLRDTSIPLKKDHIKYLTQVRSNGALEGNGEVLKIYASRLESSILEVERRALAIRNSSDKNNFPALNQAETETLLKRLEDHLSNYEKAFSIVKNEKKEMEGTNESIQEMEDLMEIVMKDLKGFPDAQTRNYTAEKMQQIVMRPIEKVRRRPTGGDEGIHDCDDVFNVEEEEEEGRRALLF
ncbi:hypothetical protein PFISCL1PPCAC_19273 [Pristionchus fissidentatus]|uniref:Uncharacterized protein n=1 Tax=Pristionchus fissidentatus TaxID=1538716 RepID=A0AAV5W721_9BILA|nr:hypothetical protein PFISCL1PPCAC_19273 [Pristionchus fissidentatus]